MPILEITGLRKTYTTRLGGNRVEALKNVSFTAEPGEYIAIMGESGSGKTTLLNILAALDKPTGGSVILDGMDLAKIKESKLADFRRDNLGFVFQEFNLLDTFTVRDNILLPLVLRGEKYPAMQPKLNSTAELLGISALLDKYPYEISGGQKQRLCIARALLRRPKILILDDSTSAVDTKTDAKIRAGLASYLPNTTKLIIAQRISSVQDADRIIVMEGGRIAQIGNHDELLKTSEIYRETFTSQNKMSAEGEGAVEADTEASVTQAQTQEGGEAHE